MAEQNKQQVDKNQNSTMQKKEQPKNNSLQQGSSSKENPKETTKLANPKKQDEKPDLNLKLSLGGIYAEKPKEKPLNRSSSVTGVLTVNKGTVKHDAPVPNPFRSLPRSTSLPAAPEHEQRRVLLKELARRRAAESAPRQARQKRARGGIVKKRFPTPEAMPSSPSKVPAWAAASAAKSPALRRALFKIKTLAVLSGNTNAEGAEGLAAEIVAPSAQLPTIQKETQPQAAGGTSANGNAVNVAEADVENPCKKAKVSQNGFEDNGIDLMKQMPTVTTRGDGPNGRMIEGFLYKYTKEQVTIVCICHGSFFSPAEFVKHAGGKDVPNPMKHIGVSFSS